VITPAASTHGVVDAKPVGQPKSQRRHDVENERRRADREERPAEMPGKNSIGEIDDAVDGEQPHAGKMPLQGSGKPILVVKVHRALVTAPEGELDRKIEGGGCTEAIMLAHGFTIEQMVELVRAGLASMTAERLVAGGKRIEVARVQITEAGRKALAETMRARQ
jgi:hypothetical protein